MSLTQHFSRLGAPLANSRWSWGAVRESDGSVFLRVWQDQKIKNGNWYMMVTHHEAYVGNESSLGYQERLRHLEFIKKGAPSYLVTCVVRDPNEIPRKVKSFNRENLFLGGQFKEHNGDLWLELKGKALVSDSRQWERG